MTARDAATWGADLRELVESRRPKDAANALRPTRSSDETREGLAMKATRICSIEECSTSAVTRGWCEKHYYRWRRHGDPTKVFPRIVAGEPSQRFWAKVTKGAADECWIYGGTILNTGYGQISFGKKNRVSAHRFAYEDAVGPIPAGLTIDHLCCVRACVNPAHMEPVTASENTLRVHRRARGEHV